MVQFNALLGIIGRDTIRALLVSVDFALFTYAAIKDCLHHGSLSKRLGYSPLANQIAFGGIGALPLMSLLGVALGFALTYRFIILIDVVGRETVLELLVKVIALELGPLLTAIVLISRSGSAIAVELATMKRGGETESLELLGVNLNHYLVGPRLFGSAVAQLGLAVYFSSVTLVTGILIAGKFESPTYLNYFGRLATSFEPMMLIGFVVKNLLFGLLIGGAACFHGLEPGDSGRDLARALRASIITSLTLVFVADSLIALILW